MKLEDGLLAEWKHLAVILMVINQKPSYLHTAGEAMLSAADWIDELPEDIPEKDKRRLDALVRKGLDAGDELPDVLESLTETLDRIEREWERE